MTVRTAQDKKTAWQVTRRFDGSRGPEELLRALIRAHSR